MAKFALPQFKALAAGEDDSALLRWAPIVLTGVLVAVAAWLVTSWFWYFWPQGDAGTKAAEARARPAQSPSALGETVAGARLFGVSARATAPTAETVSTLSLKLKGVFAPHRGTFAAAIVNSGQKDEYVGVGREVVPGVVLDQVFPTYVLLRRGEQVERVNMEERVSLGGASRASPMIGGRPGGVFPPSTPQPPANPPPAPPNFPSPVVNPQVNPQIPGGLPGQIPGAIPGGAPPIGQQGTRGMEQLRATAQGLVVDEVKPGSMLAKVGLQSGDVLKTLDGQRAGSPDDLVRAYHRAAAGETVRGEVIRDGRTVAITVPTGR